MVPDVDVNLVVETALKADVEAVYKSDWFTQLWVVQELAFARNPRILCGVYSLSWKEFELATRIIASCLGKISHPPKALWSIKHAWEIIWLRGRYSLNMRPVTAGQVIYRFDQPWSIGRLAWDMRNKKCKDDRDKVYAPHSLTASGNSLKVFLPDPFIPDYTRPVEWAYYQFWRRFEGYTSLFHDGLSRRRGYSKTTGNKVVNENVSVYFNDSYLPSWVPDLRPHHTNEWEPIFDSDYATSTPMHHWGSYFDLTEGTGILKIRGHCFDSVVREFHISQQIDPC
ncbi:hypothetical protein G7Y89_g11928 [Cudoniella acicularis]|uniref:Heterokaryon incompatibility domain-containing protein n=1 Tax=Cudoniella acicularis TaxID=354080 RepID=A0A8H4VXV0_9HELO|nr:hypothetical protein G7Y89_g11928 [Cudoniella acicularis]